jgi:hypothetical protein
VKPKEDSPSSFNPRRKTMNIIKEVRAAWVQREIKRLLPQASHKAEPVEQRRNPARAARKAAKRAAKAA